MKEREYCFKVKSLIKSLKFCEENGFMLKDKSEQTRTIFRKSDKTMARITIEKKQNIVKYFLDFKEDKLTNLPLNIREESKPLEVFDLDAVYSILNFLKYTKDNILYRKKWTLVKGKVICEIDLYDGKNNEIVVSIEGDDVRGVDETYFHFIKYMED